jgi:hypothetical protein
MTAAPRLPRPHLRAGVVSIVYIAPDASLAHLGSWPCSVRGTIDVRGPPALHPDLADWIECQLALGRTSGLIRDGPNRWHWTHMVD